MLTIEDISEGYGGLQEMTRLDLSFRGLGDVSVLENLTNLTELYLDCNDLKDVLGLRILPI